MKKRIIALCMAAALMSVTMAACQGESSQSSTGGESSTPESSTQKESVNITMSHCQGEWSWPALEAVMEQYTAASGNTVELLYVPSEEYNTWITSQFAGGTEPDVIWSAGQPAGDFYKNQWIIDLKPYLEAESPYTGATWQDSFSGNILNGVIDPNGSGAMVGIPMSISMVNLYYNKDLCEELGLDVSQPLSWSQLLEYCEIIQEKNPDLVPMSVMNSTSWNLGWQTNFMMEHIWADMVDVVDVVDQNGRIDTPEAAAAVKSGAIKLDDQRMVDFYNYMRELSKYFNNGFNTASWEYESLFNEGKAVFNLNGSWFPSQVLQNELDINYGTLPIPYVDSGITDKTDNRLHEYSIGLGGPDLMITQKGMDEGRGEAAIDLLQFLTDPGTGAKDLCEEMMSIPVVEGVEVPEELKGITDYIGEDEQAVNYNASVLAMTAEANDQYNVMFANFLDDDSITAEELAANVQALYLEAADEAIASHEEWDIDAAIEAINSNLNS